MTTTLIAYRTPPLQEFRARRELREAGHKAYLPTDRAAKRKTPIARGYVFATGKPADAKHVRGAVGPVPPVQLLRLYTRRDRGHEPKAAAWSIGGRATITVGKHASMTCTLIRKRGRRQWIADVEGKPICVQTDRLVRIDPG